MKKMIRWMICLVAVLAMTFSVAFAAHSTGNENAYGNSDSGNNSTSSNDSGNNDYGNNGIGSDSGGEIIAPLSDFDDDCSTRD